jgi:hypothetical protein
MKFSIIALSGGGGGGGGDEEAITEQWMGRAALLECSVREGER